MKKSIQLLMMSMFLSPLINAQVKDFVIEPPVKPNLYLYKSFGVFGGKEYSANAVYLTTKKGVVLFDVPWQKEQYQTLMDTIQKRHHLPVIAVFATHSHDDRAGDLSFYNQKGIKTYATAKTNELLKKDGKATSTEIIKTGKPYKIGGEEFMVDFLGEGHTVDNVVVWFPKYKVLDGGCLVKSRTATDLGYTGEANVKQWPETMRKLKTKYAQATLVIPGHDEWKGGGHVQHTLDLLDKNKKPE
ncbi:subclass B1 metallo-beta-lactamase IND-2 [Chryseobacterium indologenes]|uniref:beta-lactamase n=2 Tax=Chryseobacterium indologenes TaxID=253 RepID=Q9ETN2_CHRID|nr:subclass B1 metallo-beta-lactamase IND-2 [Chryseobacterium indologenes]AAG29757.1 metallo-beta-lactamase IND-2 [Chryseobacterium indologenes]AAG29759.1 metallo-beta-lactamase IND-2 [Chryseobacterium indologenes]ABS29620.1 class B carbapenemase IND-2 [Chryseobacterium indologenes]ACZ65150.1 class B carbapenemase IND-2 [Chryseobacterium indologenes]ATN05378.1 subclass B1 metallo-beta-lactamase IND-2 [Chryseobacterium indologenes]